MRRRRSEEQKAAMVYVVRKKNSSGVSGLDHFAIHLKLVVIDKTVSSGNYTGNAVCPYFRRSNYRANLYGTRSIDADSDPAEVS
ncbi:hypothetical protein PoB_006566000 [Plakobranchus ocellatus]|uniref:Uncharacterized protein n=1 Tax=Plakobranchus ocellatus TaxID=259542 RepID=A0AAV4D4Z6_9GAST|nr:hypothetical protein PoB_006566000 [Plakobranchus ocellatus]